MRVGSRTPRAQTRRRYFETALGYRARTSLGSRARRRCRLVISVIERSGGTVLHGPLLLSRWRTGGQAPQTHAHRHGAPDLGLRRQLPLPVIDTGLGKSGRHLLNYMPPPRAAMYRSAAALLRADRRRSRNLAGDHAPHRPKAVVSCSACQFSKPANAPESGDPWRQPDRRSLGKSRTLKANASPPI